MKLGKINWTFHNNLPIHSIDLQPNSFRFVTGGSDGKVCVWNLLPVIAEKYEVKNNRGQSENNDDREEQKISRDGASAFEQ